MKLCHHCGREIQLLSELQRTDSCPQCYSDLKVCLNCRFFDPGKNNQCSETSAEYVRDKSKANFCDYFEPNKRLPLNTRDSSTGAAKTDVRSAFDDLFKKK